MKLNKNQNAAANQLEGNLLIIASAGTGKTTTIIERYINLIEKKGLSPKQIVMTTFTNKAAKDMTEKIKKRTKKISPYIGTMHSLFLKILRDHEDLVTDKPFTILTDNKDRNKIVKNILTNHKIENDTNAVRYFSSWISKFKNRAIFAEDLSIEGSIDDLKNSGQITEALDDGIIRVNPLWRTKVNIIYKKYQDYLKKNYLLDFDEILMRTFRLFEDFPNIKEMYKNNFRAIMVDEAQDLSLIQEKILDQISSNNICFIGDDCQNIYEWRGSSNEIIFDFNEMEKSTFLEENYRSSDQIIQAVNNSINMMKHKIEKKLIPTKGPSQEIIIQDYLQLDGEMWDVAEKIMELIENGESPENIAVLFRMNLTGKILEKELIKRSIPCHLSKNITFFEREEIKDIISIIRLKINPESFYDFERLSKLIKGLGKISIKKIEDYRAKEDLGFQEVLLRLDKLGFSVEINKTILSLFESLKKQDVNEILIHLGYYDYLKRKYSEEQFKLAEKYENIATFISLYKENYSSFKEFIDSLHEIEKKEDIKGKVILSTIHSAKGLEWKHVFLVSCNEGILPFYKGELTQIKKDSELRLFYVAISRAKEGLYISSHFKGGYANYTPSQFLDII